MSPPAGHGSIPETIPVVHSLCDEVVSEHSPRPTLAMSYSCEQVSLKRSAASVVLPTA